MCIRDRSNETEESTDDNKEKAPLEKTVVIREKTSAELAFKLAQEKRIMERIEDKLKSTPREKLEAFNRRLSKLPEHFDIPRVGPGQQISFLSSFLSLLSFIVLFISKFFSDDLDGKPFHSMCTLVENEKYHGTLIPVISKHTHNLQR
eukprot:TRINITY_DN7662_c0_g1_i1.p2 TRINITY_DN7662_c0_g1~~TRINITY_DN7662_c0_g1_i1.p2  ORF type:complete len:148 (-),score=5.77 TRINITY_DN7662_c0_g1_i1:141-584(-)